MYIYVYIYIYIYTSTYMFALLRLLSSTPSWDETTTRALPHLKQACLYRTGPQQGKVTTMYLFMVLRTFLERVLDSSKNHVGFVYLLLPGLA